MRRRLVRVTTVKEYLIPEEGQSTLEERVEHTFRQLPFNSALVERSGYGIVGSEEVVGVEVTDRSVDF